LLGNNLKGELVAKRVQFEAGIDLEKDRNSLLYDRKILFFPLGFALLPGCAK